MVIWDVQYGKIRVFMQYEICNTDAIRRTLFHAMEVCNVCCSTCWVRECCKAGSEMIRHAMEGLVRCCALQAVSFAM
jgi:hypothetical protein